MLKINIKCIKIIKCALLHLIRGFFKAFISTYFAACKSRGTSSDKLTVEVECRRRIGSIFFKRDLGYAIVIKHLSWFSNAQLFLTLFLWKSVFALSQNHVFHMSRFPRLSAEKLQTNFSTLGQNAVLPVNGGGLSTWETSRIRVLCKHGASQYKGMLNACKIRLKKDSLFSKCMQNEILYYCSCCGRHTCFPYTCLHSTLLGWMLALITSCSVN